MKKKIFLIAFMVIALACILAVSTFAAAYDKNRTSIEYKGQSVPVVKFEVEVSTVNDAIKTDTARGHECNLTSLTAMADNDAYVILKDTAGNLTAYPSWWIIDAANDKGQIYEICYAYLNSISNKTGKTYNEGAIVYMEFPQGLTYVRNNGVFGVKQSAAYETNVTDFYIPKTATGIGSNAFNSMPKLENVFIEAGNTISQINSGTFSNSTVKYVQIENLTEITSIDGFTKCGITGDLDFSHSTKLKTIGAGCFQYSNNIGKITLPNSVETIGDSAFENIGAAYLASPYLPTSLKTVGKRFFAYCSGINDTFIFPEGVTSLGSEPFQDSPVKGGPAGKELNLIFLGKVTGVIYLNGNGHQYHAEKVTVYFAQNSLSDYGVGNFKIKPSGSSTTSIPGAIRAVFCAGTGAGTNGNVTGIEYVYITDKEGVSISKNYVNDADDGFDFENHTHYGAVNVTAATCGKDGFEGKNCIVCDTLIGTVLPATGNHTTENDHDCTTALTCTVCNKVMAEALAEHAYHYEIAYANGFLTVGSKIETCTNEDCAYNAQLVAKALFTYYGHSKDKNSTRICIGYDIDYAAVNEYKAANSQIAFEYGLCVAVADYVPTGSPVEIVDGKVQALTLEKGKVIVHDLTQYDTLSHVDFKLEGDYSNYQTLGILMSAYIYDGTSLSYLNNTQSSTIKAVTIDSITE